MSDDQFISDVQMLARHIKSGRRVYPFTPAHNRLMEAVERVLGNLCSECGGEGHVRAYTGDCDVKQCQWCNGTASEGNNNG